MTPTLLLPLSIASHRIAIMTTAMTPLEWRGPHAYFKSSGARLTLRTSPSYSFNSLVPSQDVSTGPMGQFIEADWTENGRDRLVRFGFFPRTTDGQNPVQDAKDSGWTLSSVDARDNTEEDILFRESFVDWDLRPTTLAVEKSDQLFSCEKFKVTLRDTEYGDDIGTFEADNALLGAFLKGQNNPNNPNYDPDSMEQFNPCTSFNGQSCRAEDGVVYCGDTLYTPPNRPAADVHLDYYGPNSFLDVVDAAVDAPGTDPDYTFRDFQDRIPEHNSGNGGDRITRETWREDHGGRIYNRDIRFFFVPTGGTTGSDYQKARESGYRIYKLQLRDGSGGWQQWENSSSMMTVPVNRGFDYFDCEKIEFDLPDGMSYKSEFSWIGGYLQDDYDFTQLRGYNPCRELPGYSGTCRSTNGIVFCGGVGISGDETLPPSPTPPTPTPPPGPSPTPAPTAPKSGISIESMGDKAYLSGNNVEGRVNGDADYTFKPDSGKAPAIDTNNGMFIQSGGQRDWVENRRVRSLYFAAYSTSSGSRKPLILVESKMLGGKSSQDWLWWTRQSGSFTKSMIVIPSGFDGFECHRAEFTYKSESGGSNSPARSSFVSDNFRFGNYLRENYSPNSLNFYRPCENLPDPGEYGCQQGRECRCEVLDGQVSCNGKDVPFEVLYPDIGAMPQPSAGTVGPAGVGARSSAVALGRRRRRSVGVVVMLVTAAAAHGGVLF